jgi:tripartite-type tricarboxylate transporter receptor subunit TctC
VQASAWFGIVAPPKTPPEIANKLSAEFAAILREPEIVKRWQELTLGSGGGTPDELRAFFKDETERWRKVIVTGGIKQE